MNASQINWEGDSSQSHTNVLVTVHRLLRGKYIIAIVLGLIFGIVGGVLGYLSQEPQYRTTGVIRIQPTLPKVLYESEQSTAPKMFASFVSSQAQLISNGGVIQNAKESDGWKSVEHLTDISTVSDIRRGLIVRPDRRAQEIITVSFSDANPQVSEMLVKEVMSAYLAEYGMEGSIRNPEIQSALTSRRKDLEAQRKSKDEQIARIAGIYRTEDLAPLIQAASSELSRLNSRKEFYLEQIENYNKFQEEDNATDTMTIEDAAGFDQGLADLLSRKENLVDAREEMMVSEGLRAGHRDVRRLTAMIESVDKQIETRFEELKSGNSSTPRIDENGEEIPDVLNLQRELVRVNAQIENAEIKSTELYNNSVKLTTYIDERAGLQDSINEVKRRIDEIDTESKVDDMEETLGRISIPSQPKAPSEPTSDPRIKTAAMGFVGLGSLPVMAVLALGFFSHKVQYSDDEILSNAKSGIVGMLPDLGDSISDPELAAASAFAVHQIRSQLQIKNRLGEHRIYGVTSPASQDGKTSMIIALGLSFAESGDRTLLVDLDFIGRGLSIHFGHPQAESLAEHLDSESHIDSLIQSTEYEGLSVLPAGFGDDERVSRLSPRSVGALFQNIREKYDTILVDTGPILGSVEAAFVSPQADGVIAVIGRGQDKRLVKKAMEQISLVDGELIATIFNRASNHELNQSSSSMSVHFSRQMSRQAQEVSKHDGMRIGPVAGTLFRSKPKDDHEPTVRITKP